MSNRSRGAVIVAVAAALLASWAVLPPKRWMDIHPGLHRAQVHAVLGAPYADYFGIKAFDGWTHAFGVGRLTLTVRYAENSDIVASTKWDICTMRFAYCMELPPRAVAAWLRPLPAGAQQPGAALPPHPRNAAQGPTAAPPSAARSTASAH
jgi:hypothetical protein